MNVKWDSEKCCHSGKCVGALPEVFKIENGQFLIQTENGSDADIMKVVEACPAKAFTAES